LNKVSCAAGAVALAVAAGPAAAQQPAPPVAFANGTAVAPPRVGITSQTVISLEDAIARALANNPDVAVARVAEERATLDVAAARGAFDPTFSVQTSFLRQVMPISSLIGGAASGRLTQENLVVGPEMTGTFRPLGTRYDLSLTTQRQTSDNQFITLNPQFPTALSLNVTQPLFRGLTFDEPRRRIEVARQTEALSEVQLRQRIMEISFQTEQAYWDLALAEQNLQVQLQGVALAQQQVESSRRLADQGVGAPIDVVEASTQVANFQQNVYAALAALTRAENALKVLILPDRASPLWSSALSVSGATEPEVPSEAVDEAVRQAIARRPELTQSTIAAAVSETNTRFFRDQTKPRIDLVGSYTSTGLAGRVALRDANPLTAGFDPLIARINALSVAQGLSPLPSFSGGGSGAVPPLLLGGYGQSLSTLFGQDFPTVQVGVQISLPLRNDTAEANLAASIVDGRRIKLERQRLEESIEADVRNALQLVASSQARLDAAVTARQLAEEQYASEQRRFEAGTSTLFLVLQRQTALIGSRAQAAQAETDLSKAIATLNRATGRTLEVHNVSVR
jgi:HAE1 family hydrophobic/amphiphilic exporter-1